MSFFPHTVRLGQLHDRRYFNLIRTKSKKPCVLQALLPRLGLDDIMTVPNTNFYYLLVLISQAPI
jgi:hypothetical protein